LDEHEAFGEPNGHPTKPWDELDARERGQPGGDFERRSGGAVQPISIWTMRDSDTLSKGLVAENGHANPDAEEPLGG
jgi:hypothetical protein